MEQEIKTEITYQGVKKSRIFLARFMDFCIWFILSAVLLMITVSITVVTPQFNNILNRAEEIQLDSKIYVKNDKDEVLKLTAFLNSDKELKTEEKNQKLDEALYTFYTNPNFFDDNEGIDVYNKYKMDAKKDNKNLFILKDGQYIENKEAGILPSTYLEFYSDTLNFKAAAALQSNKEYHKLSQTVTMILVVESLTMPFLMALILFVLVPTLSFKNHNTWGFKTFKIGVIDASGFSISTKKAVGASLFSTLFVVWVSLVTFFIPLIVSLGMFVYREDNKNLTGYIFNYYYVDISSKKIYENEEQYQNSAQKFEKESELFENTPLKEEDEEKIEN